MYVYSLYNSPFVEQALIYRQIPNNQEKHVIPFLSMFVDKNDRRRETWRWQDAPPDMGRKLGLDRDPMEYDRIFKMSFECFQHIVNWMVDKGNPNRNRSTPFQMWYKGVRASSGTRGTVSTVVGCGVLYLFSEGSEMIDCKLLGVEPTNFHSYADMVVEELCSRSSEVICFPPKAKQVCMRCSMMDAPFPGALFAMDGTLCMLTTKGKHNEYVGRKSHIRKQLSYVTGIGMGCTSTVTSPAAPRTTPCTCPPPCTSQSTVMTVCFVPAASSSLTRDLLAESISYVPTTREPTTWRGSCSTLFSSQRVCWSRTR